MSAPHVKLTTPLAWLGLADRLTQLPSWSTTLASVCAIAAECGFPSDPSRMSLDKEVKLALRYLSQHNIVLWYDTDQLRDVVIVVCCLTINLRLLDSSDDWLCVCSSSAETD